MSSPYNMSPVSVLTFLFISRTLALNCSEGYFKDKSNTKSGCSACPACGRHMVLNCTRDANYGCFCEKGYYKGTSHCHSCSDSGKNHCEKEDCKKFSPCNKKTTRIFNSTPTATPTTSTTTTQWENATSPQAPKPASAGLSPLVWLLLLVLLLPLVYCVPLLFIRNLYKYLLLCPPWENKQDVEAPPQTVSEQGCLQSLTTLKFTTSEGTPMMEVMSPVPPACPAHSAPLLPEGEHRVRPNQDVSEPFPAVVMYAVIKEVPLRRWKEFLRLLSVGDQQLERVELDAGSSSMERQYQQLRLWGQKSSASMEDIYSALHYMELAGCAEMIKESLEKLHWRPVGSCVTILGKGN